MNLSALFIRRPVTTTLVIAGLIVYIEGLRHRVTSRQRVRVSPAALKGNVAAS